MSTEEIDRIVEHSCLFVCPSLIAVLSTHLPSGCASELVLRVGSLLVEMI